MMTSLEGLLLMICLFILALFGGWRVGASFDEQSAELEAILNKLKFYNSTIISLNTYSISVLNLKNKELDDQVNERWMQYTYRLDLAKQADEEKYGNKKQVK